MTRLKKTEINAILREDFQKLLQQFGVLADFEAGKYNCVLCGDQLNTETVLIVFPLSENNIGFVCRKPECVARYKSGEEESKACTFQSP